MDELIYLITISMGWECIFVVKASLAGMNEALDLILARMTVTTKSSQSICHMVDVLPRFRGQWWTREAEFLQ